jgi:hypothetical protein
MNRNSDDTNQSNRDAVEASQSGGEGKLAWRTPTLEEVPFTRTEAGGAGAVYDFVVYSGSQ